MQIAKAIVLKGAEIQLIITKKQKHEIQPI
jgi:hypothetical protein